MATPKPKPPELGDYEAAANRYLLALERKVKADAFLLDVAALKRDTEGLSAEGRARLAQLVAPHLDAVMRDAVNEAFGTGQADALRLLHTQGVHDTPEKIAAAKRAAGNSSPKSATLARVTGLDALGLAAIEKAKRLATAGADADAVTAPIFAAANTINQAITGSLAEAINDGEIDVARTADVELVWIAEPDACVDCLAYSGQACGPGDSFPGGLTFADNARFDEDLVGPPLHPNCRCTVEPLGDPSFADALQREAQRSVLRGFSLENESMTTRVQAAGNVLASNPDAPKSVIAYAEKAVAAGGFSTRGR